MVATGAPAGRAAGNQHRAVVRQQHRRVAGARLAQRRVHGEEFLRGRIEELGRRQILGAVVAAGHQHAVVDEQRGRGARTRRRHGTRFEDAARLRIEHFGGGQGHAFERHAADDQHLAVGQPGRGMPRARCRHVRHDSGRARAGIEDLGVGAQQVGDLAADDQHAPVIEPRRRRVDARGGQLPHHRRCVGRRVVDQHAVGDGAVQHPPAGNQRRVVFERRRGGAAASRRWVRGPQHFPGAHRLWRRGVQEESRHGDDGREAEREGNVAARAGTHKISPRKIGRGAHKTAAGTTSSGQDRATRQPR